MNKINLLNMSATELKALAYDIGTEINEKQHIIRTVNQEIQNRKQTIKPSVTEVENLGNLTDSEKED